MPLKVAAVLLALIGAAPPAAAGAPEVIAAEAVRTGPAPGAGVWRFSVTLNHGDTGWEHYADAWEIRLPDGTVLGTRILHHPHVEEMPFSRSLSGVTIPRSAAQVLIYPRDSVHGWGAPYPFDLPR